MRSGGSRGVLCRLFLWILSFLLWNLLFGAAFCAHIFPYGTNALIVEFILFQAIWLLAVCSLFSTLLTKPAPIPERFVPPEELFDGRRRTEAINAWATNAKLPVKKVLTPTDKGEIRCPPFCIQCKVIKPNRTHHCRKCERCIMRMDHHCPIIGRCIHMHNHKYFLLFLFWATVLCLTAMVMTAPALYQHMPEVLWSFKNTISLLGKGEQMIPVANSLIPTCLVVSGTLNALVCGLSLFVFLYQLSTSLLRNETTLESTAFNCCAGALGRNSQDKVSYDTGSRLRNWQTIFGTNLLLWMLPLPSTYGDGSFPLAKSI